MMAKKGSALAMVTLIILPYVCFLAGQAVGYTDSVDDIRKAVLAKNWGTKQTTEDRDRSDTDGGNVGGMAN